MNPNDLVFALTTGCYDDESGNSLFLPVLEIYSSANLAAVNREGLDIVEGDLLFFACDGSSLEAKFSKQPYINSEKNTYFSGEYSLQPVSGESLQDRLSKTLSGHRSPHAWVVFYLASTDDMAQKNGWLNIAANKKEAERSLKILPPDMIKRVKFELWDTPATAAKAKH